MKSDYLDTLMKFAEYVSNQFDEKVKVVRSDNALEFADKGCTEYFAKKRNDTSKVMPSYTLAKCKGGEEAHTSARGSKGITVSIRIDFVILGRVRAHGSTHNQQIA